jgi:hypothetical protein
MPPVVPPLDHLIALSDDTGIIQHASEAVPNRSTGYCTDDVARAFMVALARMRTVPRDDAAMRLASTYLSFLHDAQIEDGRFHNFMAYDRSWLDDVGTHDSCGRALWSLGYGMRYAPTEPWRRVCRSLFDKGLQSMEWLEYTRARAYAVLGLARAYASVREPSYAAPLRHLAESLCAAYEANADAQWQWFEPVMTYDNGRLPEALLRAARALDDERFGEIGLQALRFYERVTIENGIFVPIGNDGWYPRGGNRARYAQQPLEATALIDAELAALDLTGDAIHRDHAELGLAWFYGKNSRGVTMAAGGGCYDGLGEFDVNRNMGAESTLALLAGAYAIDERRSWSLRAVR